MDKIANGLRFYAFSYGKVHVDAMFLWKPSYVRTHRKLR